MFVYKESKNNRWSTSRSCLTLSFEKNSKQGTTRVCFGWFSEINKPLIQAEISKGPTTLWFMTKYDQAIA